MIKLKGGKGGSEIRQGPRKQRGSLDEASTQKEKKKKKENAGETGEVFF